MRGLIIFLAGIGLVSAAVAAPTKRIVRPNQATLDHVRKNAPHDILQIIPYRRETICNGYIEGKLRLNPQKRGIIELCDGDNWKPAFIPVE